MLKGFYVDILSERRIHNKMHKCDDFVQVKRRRKRNRPFKTSQHNRQPSINELDHITSREDLLCEVFNAAVEMRDCSFKSKVFETLTKALDMLNADQVSQILCYGLGCFSHYKSSLHQLALIVALKKHYNCPVYIYDPLFRPTEIEILQTLRFDVIETNEEGKRVVNEQTTIIYMPHCTKELSNNFLYANWGEALTNCILIANSFSLIMDDNVDEKLPPSATYISRIYPYVTEIPVENDFKYPLVFSGFNVQIFTKPDLSNVPSNFWTVKEEPSYKEDVDFILAENTAKLHM